MVIFVLNMLKFDKKLIFLFLCTAAAVYFLSDINSIFPETNNDVKYNSNLKYGKNLVNIFSNVNLTKNNITKVDNNSIVISKSTLNINNAYYNTNITQMIPESKCSSPFMTIDDDGRLGNQVCQFMSAYFFRLEYGIRVAISSRMNSYLRKIFTSIPSPSLPHSCYKINEKSALKVDYFKMADIFKLYFMQMYNNNISKTENKIQGLTYYNHIRNYPCPISDLIKYRNELRNVLPIQKKLIQIAKEKLSTSLKPLNLTRSEITIISVHIRRTDYLKYGQKRNLTFPNRNFYFKAFTMFREKCKNVIFLIISDDLKWTKSNLKAPDVIYPGNANIKNPELDYTMLTLGDHHINSMGTFGRTSAFLGKGSVVNFDSKANGKNYKTDHFSCDTSEIFISMGN